MANIFKEFFSQCARPEGFLGRIMLNFMNYGHGPLTNWGLSHISFKDDWTMLDIGCGGGATLKRLLKRSKEGKAYGIDISPESVMKARKKNAGQLDKQIFVEQGSAEHLPYADNQFDLATAVETIYFWPNLPQCLQEVRRVLKPGAPFAIIVEVIEGDSVWEKVVEGMTVYSPEQLKGFLDDAGFTATEVHRKVPCWAAVIGVNP